MRGGRQGRRKCAAAGDAIAPDTSISFNAGGSVPRADGRVPDSELT